MIIKGCDYQDGLKLPKHLLNVLKNSSFKYFLKYSKTDFWKLLRTSVYEYSVFKQIWVASHMFKNPYSIILKLFKIN